MPERKVKEYEVTIPERATILEFLKKTGAPRPLNDIAAALDCDTAAHQHALNRRLRAMVRDGQLIMNRRAGYGLLDKMDLVAGQVLGHADGYGFFRPDHGGGDLFLSMRQMRTVLHGDRVVVRAGNPDRRGRQEGIIVEVLERVNRTVVGRFYEEGGIAFVTPDNKHLAQDILLSQKERKEAQTGDYVVVEITRQPDAHTQPMGRIIETLGHSNTVGMATEIAIRAYGVPYEWPEGMEQELAALEHKPTMKGRKDLRELPLVTIDGADARDFDDAVYCEKLGDEWRLLVAIADVSHYVRPGSVLDQAAHERGNSVYFPARVAPMLPELLSNDLCSLIPGKERPAMICDMRVNRVGRVKQHKLYPAMIKSRSRLTYELVSELLEGGKSTKKHQSILPHILNLHALYQLMRGHRQSQGVLDFSSGESRLCFDKQGRVVDIKPLTRGVAHRIIEEFMLAANVSVAEFLLTNDIPAIYRNHATPAEDKINDLNQFLADFGLQLGGGLAPGARHYAKLLKLVATRTDRHLVETVLLRSMPLAVYEGQNKGHFGLAFDQYTHFTSPIRRYPDLLVHRAIRHLLDRSGYDYGKGDMHNHAAHCSMTERRAEEASRDVVSRMKCEFMLDKIGKTFAGLISGVTGFGLFVELDGSCVEGLVHISALPADYYHFDPIAHSLSGERTGRKYFLGDRVTVRTLGVNADERKIDFEYVA